MGGVGVGGCGGGGGGVGRGGHGALPETEGRGDRHADRGTSWDIQLELHMPHETNHCDHARGVKKLKGVGMVHEAILGVPYRSRLT